MVGLGGNGSQKLMFKDAFPKGRYSLQTDRPWGGGEEQKSRDINRIQIVSSVRQAITSKADYERITLAHKSFLDTGSRGDSLRGI